MVPPIRPFPKVYTRTRRGKLAAEEKYKAQVLPEILEVHKEQQENKPIDYAEELLKEARYKVTSKNKKEEIKPVVGARKRHTSERNKYRLKSTTLNNPSLLTEVIVIKEQHVELQIEDPSIAEIRRSLRKQRGKAPMDQPSKPSKRSKVQKEAKKKETIIKEETTRITRSKSATINQTNLDKLAEAASHMK